MTHYQMINGERVPMDAEDIPSNNPIHNVHILSSSILWQRMTNEEAEQVKAAMESFPFRIQQIFLTSVTFRSDHDLWPILVETATNLFGVERTNELILKD